jgi:hypothetical protein
MATAGLLALDRNLERRRFGVHRIPAEPRLGTLEIATRLRL